MENKLGRLKKAMANKGKATAELDASRDPMKFIQDNKNMSIKGLRGVAFANGGGVPEISDDTINNFLGPIRQIESSGGKDVEHPTVESGIHAGDTAMGQYGLMPNTVSEVANRARLQKEYAPDLISATLNPEVVKDDPKVEDQVARQLAAKLLNQFHGNQEQAAYAWNQGHNLTPEQVQQRDYRNSPYVQKFIKLKQMMNQKPK